MGHYDWQILDELKNLNKNLEKLVHGVNVLAGIEAPGVLNEADLKVLARHIGPGIAGMDAEEAKAAGWESPGVINEVDHNTLAKHMLDTYRKPYGDFNIEAILERADVEWYDDPVLFSRRVISRNPDAPLTESEQDTLRRMWEAQGCRLHIVFEEAGGE